MSSDPTESIGIIEDHELTRIGIHTLIADQPGLVIAWAAGSAEQAKAIFQERPTDIILTDINLPNESGIEFVKWLSQKAPDCKIIVVSMYDYYSYVKELLELGVKGYILKNEAGSDLLLAVMAVREGKSYFSSSITQTLLKKQSDNKSNADLLACQLTERERQIIALVAKEYSNKEIANTLCLSPKTIENYKNNLFQKTGVKNSLGLVRYAFENGLL